MEGWGGGEMEGGRVERNELYKMVGEKTKNKKQNLQNPPGKREMDVKPLFEPVSNRLRQFEP